MENRDIHEDRWLIQQLLCRWCGLVDQHASNSMGEVFTDDVIGVYNGMEVPGLKQLIDSGNENMTRDTIACTKHNVLNFRIEIEGDAAHCVTNYYAVHQGAGDFAGEIYSMGGTMTNCVALPPVGASIGETTRRSSWRETTE